MLKITVPSTKLWDEAKEVFIDTKEYELRLEHSLVSISKWESKWCKPFLTNKDMKDEEAVDYVRCMTITQNVDPMAYQLLTKKIMDEIAAYIVSSMTATTFSKDIKKATNKEIITSEVIYYWMVAFNIPWEAQTWHLNRLLTLVNICSIKNQPKKKVNRQKQLEEQRALNNARKAKLGTSG